MDNTSFAPGNNSINSSVPPPTPQYSAPEHKHFLNKKFAVTFVILLLLGTGAYAGIWYWQNQQVAEVVPTFTPRASALPDPTAGWKTYTSTNLGYSLSYPGSWIVNTENQGKSNEAVSFNRPDQKDFTLAFAVGVEARNLNQIRDRMKAATIPKSTETIMQVSGQTSYQYTYPGTSDSVIIYVPYQNKVYVLSSSEPSSEEFNQILSTFKFTDSTGSPQADSADTSTWKTYAYTGVYSFNFMYPADWVRDSNTIYSSKAPKGVYGVADKISVETFANNSQLSIENWRTKNIGDVIIKDNGSISIASAVAHQYIVGGMVNYISTYISEGSIIIKISIPQNTQYFNIYNQIISTFRLLQ